MLLSQWKVEGAQRAGPGGGAGAGLAGLITVLLLAAGAAPAGAQQPDRLLSRAITREAGLEGRLVWVDGYANVDVLSSRAGIAGLTERIRQARLNTICFGAKMFGGHALYASQLNPRLTEWKGHRVPPDHDILQVLLEEAHARGLKVHASIDVFADGHRLTRTGPAFDHPEWQTIVYRVRRELVTADGQRLPIYATNTDLPGEVVIAFTPGYGWRKPKSTDAEEVQVLAILAGPSEDMRILSVTDCALLRDGQPVEAPSDGLLLYGRGAMGEWMLRNLRPGERIQFTAVDKFVPITTDELEGTAIFVNPVLPEVRQHALALIREIAGKYDVDGLVFDRMRFNGINADFSDYTRGEFEKAIGKKVERWPDDILKIDPIPGRPVVRGPLFQAWIEWRAGQITSFLKEAIAAARAVKPEIRLGVYVGSWYDRYFQEGVNWASPDYVGSADWMTATYGQTGYAHLVDYITTGCYYPRTTLEAAVADDAPIERTVEVAALNSSRVVNDASFVYAGLFMVHYKDDPQGLKAAIEAARRNSQGVMLFDAVYLNQYQFWNVLQEVFPTPAAAPHDVPELLPAVRSVRQSIRALAPAR